MNPAPPVTSVFMTYPSSCFERSFPRSTSVPQVYFRGRTQQIERTPDGYILSLPLPFVEKGEVNLLHAGDELMVQIGQARRNIILPRTLVGLTTRGATFEGDVLKIRFGR